MKILREVEAVNYLGRLEQTLGKGLAQIPHQEKELPSFSELPPFSYFRSILQIELSYFQRLIRNEATRGLAALVVSSSGFPELPSLMVDMQKAYHELGSIQASIGNAVRPLLSNLGLTADLEAYDSGVKRVISDFEKDQKHIDLLRRLQGDCQSLNVNPVELPETKDNCDATKNKNKGSRIFTNQEKPGLLFYETGVPCQQIRSCVVGWLYEKGFLKYIDSEASVPLLIISGTSCYYGTGEEYVTFPDPSSFLKTFPDLPKILEVLNRLNADFREEFLSVNCTALPDGGFDKFIQTSAKMGSLLEHVNAVEKRALTVVPEQKTKKWWNLGR